MIYLDNAATTLRKPTEVYLRSNEVFRYYSANAGRSGHKPAVEAAEIIYSARCAAAEFLNIEKTENVIFTFGCTDSLNLVIKGLFSENDHVITTAYEHNSVLRPLEYMKANSMLDYTVLFPEEDGKIRIESFENAIQKNTKAIIVNFVSNVTGYVQNLKEISELCAKRNLLLIADCAQGAGVQKIECHVDYLCCACHKGLYGPQGIGILAISPSAPLPTPLRFGGTGSKSFDLVQPKDMPEYLESGTMSVQNIASVEAGIRFVQANREKIYAHETKLANLLIKGLHSIKGVTVYSPSKAKSGVVAFNIRDIDSNVISQVLDKQFCIASRGGFHCAPLVHKFLNTQTQGAVRLSIGIFNTEKEIFTTLNAIEKIAKSL